MKKIYVLMTCLMALTFGLRAQDACSTAVSFDWSGDNTQEANTTVWYKVSLTPLKNEAGMDLRLFINNMSTTDNADVTCVAYIGSCSGTSQDKSTVIVPAGHKEITIQRAMIEALGFPNIYIMMTTSQKVVFSASIVTPEITTDTEACADAVDFNWAKGHDQAAGTSVWYRVDISNPKTTANTGVTLLLQNLTNSSATVIGTVAVACPTTGTTTYSKVVGANQTLSKNLGHSLLAALNISEVYVQVSTTGKVHIGASTYVEEDKTPDTACESAIDFDWENGHTQAQGTQWYRVNLATLREKGNVTLTLKNLTNASNLVVAEGVFECPVTSDMLSKTYTLGANATAIKNITEEDVNALDATLEYAYVRLTTQGSIQFVVEQTPDCKNAVAFDWTNGHDQEAGTSVWYRVDISDVKNSERDGALLHLKNLTAETARVDGTIAFACPATTTTSYTKMLAPNADLSKLLGHSIFEMLNVSEVYVNVVTDKKIHVGAEAYEEPVTLDTACESAIDFDWENGHAQAQGTQWYRVDLATLRAKGSVELTLTNEEATSTSVTAEVAFECPVTSTMLSKTTTLGANVTATKVLDAAEVDALDAALEYVYVRLTTTGSIAFVVDIYTSLKQVDVEEKLLNVENVNGGIRIVGAEEQMIEVYSMMGVCVAKRCLGKDSETMIELPTGVYVVKGGKETVKLVVY